MYQHVKKIAFLGEKSAKALTPPFIGTTAIFHVLFFYMEIYMFLKPANSDMEMALKKNQKSPLKKSCTC